jgi:hypothetical protein
MKSPLFSIYYQKTKKIDVESWISKESKESEESEEFSPFEITDIQQYNPIYSEFFELNEQNYNRISLNHKYQIQNTHSVLCTETQEILEKPVFVKFSPLLDPIRYMIGKYDLSNENIRILPTISDLVEPKAHSKLIQYNNASYIDGFFSFLTSVLLNHHGFKHGIDFYGSFLGIQKRFKINIDDDLEYLQQSDFFNKNNGKMFSVDKYERDEVARYGSRGIKYKIHVEDLADDLLNDVIEIDQDLDMGIPLVLSLEKTGNYVEEVDMVYEKADTNDVAVESTDTDTDSSNDSELNYSTGSDMGVEGSDNSESWETDEEGDEDEDEDGDEDDDGDGDQAEIHAQIHDFPIQMICLEKCDGTLDELFENEEIDPKKGASALFQVIMSLIAYQKAFHFTHNDLHTNNIMYVNTDEAFLYYIYEGVHYKVPTYGRIFKIIDFGRGIYKFNHKAFCSDSFAPGGDAATQYNFEPFMNKKKPRLEPNMGFDLCRLGCSIYDFIIEDDMQDISKMNALQETIYRWCLDDNQKNVLYKKDGEERYPNFKLYKMIARTVHSHTPQAQLKFDFFKQFTINNAEYNRSKGGMNIDVLPCYI